MIPLVSDVLINRFGPCMSRFLLLIPFLFCMTAPVIRGDDALVIDVAPVWSAHPVGFFLLNDGDQQFVAFYDAERHMTVGVRDVEADQFQFVRLPQQTGWDSHNYITMAIDDDGFLHLSGDMHNVPLIYFRTERPRDITTFQKIPSMVGRDETRITYPRFFRGPGGEFIYTYRQGGSGNGEQVYNVYDHQSQTWRRLLDQPLVTGEGKMNAYLQGPSRGPDGYWHLVWIWRDTYDCSTNHTLSYARSRDLIRWERSSGEPINLPITIATGDVIDPVPPRGGAINGNTRLGFDSQRRPVVAYHKFDDEGNTQLYNARLEEGGWKIYQTSRWDYRWWFEGGGSIIFEVRPQAVRVEGGRLVQDFYHVKYGQRRLVLDEETLLPVDEIDQPPARPAHLETVKSDFPGMEVRWAGASGRSSRAGVRHWLRWETLPQHRDRARDGDLPAPVMLQVYEISN